MRSLYFLSGPLRRHPRTVQPTKILKRYKFFGRPESSSDGASHSLIPDSPARTRFAPSPTGYLHLGSLRTALYNYLLAKATGGQFLLRLEDTDQTRLVPDAEVRLYEDLKWAGLDWEEGPDVGGPHGPYKQSARLQTYQTHAKQLLDSGHAYRCFCTPEELDALKRWNLEHGSEASSHQLYNGKCRHVSPSESDRRAANGESHCVRFKSEYIPTFKDLVYGTYTRPEKEDDFILMKRDGYPTYHFANVVDDHAMEITHVVRGAEWLTSTSRHILLYDAFSWVPPTFAHVGLLCNSKGEKLSKRSGDIDISSFRDRGILPVSLLNYAVLLGWSPGRGSKGTSEVMDLGEMVDKFHMRFTRGNIKISNKLDFFQAKHMARTLENLTPERFQSLLLPGLLRELEAIQQNSTSSSPGVEVVRGDQLPLARPRPGNPEDEKIANAQYIFNVVDLDKGSKISPRDTQAWLERNIYLFFEIPFPVYQRSLTETLSKAGELFKGDATAQPSAVTRELHGLLLSVTAEQWTKTNLEAVIDQPLKSIFASPPGSEAGKRKPFGNQWLRWILFAGRPGPALVPSLEVLGRTEVLRRVNTAIEAIEKQQGESAQ